MAQNPPPYFPRITPYLLYEDVPGALEWLSTAFGFRERLRFTGPDGTVNHAEMEFEDGVIMLGDPGDSYRNPARGGGVTVQLHVYVDDVDAHFERARAAGAKIRKELTDESTATAGTTRSTPRATCGRSPSTSETSHPRMGGGAGFVRLDLVGAGCRALMGP